MCCDDVLLLCHLSLDSADLQPLTTSCCLCRAVFDAYGVRVFLCFWHVKRSWLKNLHKKCSRSVQYQMFLGMERIMLMLPSTHQSRESFTEQVHGAVALFCTQYAEQADYVSYFQKQWGWKTGQCVSAHASCHWLHCRPFVTLLATLQL